MNSTRVQNGKTQIIFFYEQSFDEVPLSSAWLESKQTIKIQYQKGNSHGWEPKGISLSDIRKAINKVSHPHVS